MAAKARRVEETRWVQERTEVDKARRVVAAAAANKEVGEKAARRSEVDMAAREGCKEAKELTWTESDEWERKGRQGAAVPARDPATVTMEKTDNNVIIVDVLPVRQQPKSVEEERMLQEKYGNMKDLEE